MQIDKCWYCMFTFPEEQAIMNFLQFSILDICWIIRLIMSCLSYVEYLYGLLSVVISLQAFNYFLEYCHCIKRYKAVPAMIISGLLDCVTCEK